MATTRARTISTLMGVLICLASTSVGAAEDAPRPATPSSAPRVIVTGLAGAGIEYVLRGLAEVRIVNGLYAGAGYAAVANVSALVGYHGPSARMSYRLPLGEYAAVTPRAGFDVIVKIRGGTDERRVRKGQSPLVNVFGFAATLHPGPIVIGVETSASLGLVEYEGKCEVLPSDECPPNAETTGEPYWTAFGGAHVGGVVGLAF